MNLILDHTFVCSEMESLLQGQGTNTSGIKYRGGSKPLQSKRLRSYGSISASGQSNRPQRTGQLSCAKAAQECLRKNNLLVIIRVVCRSWKGSWYKNTLSITK